MAVSSWLGGLLGMMALGAGSAVGAASPADAIFPPHETLERVWEHGTYTEGPAVGPDGWVYFSDIGNRIMKFDPVTRVTMPYRNPSGRSNGLDFDPKGRLVAAEGAGKVGNRRVSITETDGTVRTLADRWNGKRLNSPNDVTVDTEGRVYFSDPRYGDDAPTGSVVAGSFRIDPTGAITYVDPIKAANEAREIDAESVYRIELDGTVTRIIADVDRPNGVLLSPDMKTLYVADGNREGKAQLLSFAVHDDGSVGPKKVLFDFAGGRGVDGMCADTRGRIYAAAGRDDANGIYVFTSDGEKIAFYAVPEKVTNCTFGGAGNAWLYITAGRSLYRLRTAVAGFAVYRSEVH